MAKLNIPERYHSGIAKIRDLDFEVVQEIRSALDSAANPEQPDLNVPPSKTADNAVQAVALERKLPLKDVTQAITSMYLVKSSREQSTDEFVQEVADAMELLPNAELRLAPEQRVAFIQKLTTLLNAAIFSVVSKVHNLTTEEERVFCHARILTDLRPVFGERLEDGPHSLVVMHKLKLSFHEGGRRPDHDFFVTLDSGDLQALKKTIERAEAKAESLKRITTKRLFGV